MTKSISIANLGFLPAIFITVLKGKIRVGSHNASERGLGPELLIRSEFHIQFTCAHDVDMGTDEDRLVVNVDMGCMWIWPLMGRKILQMLKFSWCKFFGILLYLMAGLQALLRNFYVGNLQSTIVSNNIHLSAYWSCVTRVWYSTMQSMSALDLLHLGF